MIEPEPRARVPSSIESRDQKDGPPTKIGGPPVPPPIASGSPLPTPTAAPPSQLEATSAAVTTSGRIKIRDESASHCHD